MYLDKCNLDFEAFYGFISVLVRNKQEWQEVVDLWIKNGNELYCEEQGYKGQPTIALCMDGDILGGDIDADEMCTISFQHWKSIVKQNPSQALTEDLNYLLVVLMEKAAEVQQAAAKAFRFGLDSYGPEGTNLAQLRTELDQLRAVEGEPDES